MDTLFDSGDSLTRLPLSKLCTEIARNLARIGRVVVEGEVVKPITRPSGWTYFTLADRAARLPVSCPAERARRCIEAVHGARVSVTGRMVFSARNGQLHLEAEEVVPVGEGAIEAAIARTRAILASEGLLDRPRRPIPVLPRGIGVVCGAEAAVRGDIESVVAERFPGYPIVFRQATVSGAGAVEAIIGALRYFARRDDVEVVVVARGGGDPASLLPFSDEEVCRAMAAMPMAVVTAIGHERDRPLCDEISDLACNTPSLAAIRVVPDEAAFRDALDQVLAGAHALLESAFAFREDLLDRVDPYGSFSGVAERAGERLNRVELRGNLHLRMAGARERLGWVDPGGSVRSRMVVATETLGRLLPDGLLAGREAAAAAFLGGLVATLEALSPERVLERGYAVVRSHAGAVVRSPAQVAVGDGLDIRVAAGRVDAVVTETRGR